VRWVPFVVTASLAVLLQATLVRLAAAGDAFPDLPVALLATFCLGVSPAEGFAAGVVLGLGRDLFTLEPLGLGAAAMGVLGWLVSRGRPGGLSGHFMARGFAAGLCSLAMSAASLLALAVQGALPGVALALRRSLLSALATALLAVVLGGLVWRRARWFGLRPRSEFASV